ncbi:hypothetical protein [Azospirillum thermophilum]|nr:hypothetical protein [Azospirillum thermophilum]
MSHDDALEADIGAVADLIRQIVQSAYERGREAGKNETLQRVLLAVQPDATHHPVDPRTQFAGVVVPPAPAPSRPAGKASKRAPWGLVPKLVQEVAAENPGERMLTEQVATLIRIKTDHDIADSSIRSTLSELAEKGVITRLGRSEWQFPEKQEAPQAEPDGASADEIQEDASDMFG